MSGSTTESVLNLFLLHDTAEAGSEALGLLDSVAARCAADGRFDARIWRADQAFELEPHRSRAEAVPADIVVVAFSNPERISRGLIRWLGEWAANRSVIDAALAVVPLRGAPLESSMQVVADLERLAVWHGLDFLNGAKAASAAALPIAALASLPLTQPQVAQDTMEREVPIHEWGIND